MASVLQPAAAVFEPVAAVLEKAHHYMMPAMSPTFVNVFIPLSAVLGLIFAIWWAPVQHLPHIAHIRNADCDCVVFLEAHAPDRARC